MVCVCVHVPVVYTFENTYIRKSKKRRKQILTKVNSKTLKLCAWVCVVETRAIWQITIFGHRICSFLQYANVLTTSVSMSFSTTSTVRNVVTPVTGHGTSSVRVVIFSPSTFSVSRTINVPGFVLIAIRGKTTMACEYGFVYKEWKIFTECNVFFL